MGFIPGKKDTQSRWIDLAVFAVVVGFFVFSSRQFLRLQSSNTTQQETKIIERGLSSTADVPLERRAEVSTAIIKLPCEERHSLETVASLVRLDGALCEGKAQQMPQIQAANQSSKEQLMIFLNWKEKKFSTNYFPLKEGMNLVMIQIQSGKGPAKQIELQVVRKAAL